MTDKVGAFLGEMRQLVAELYRPKLEDHGWKHSIRERCQHLANQLGHLREVYLAQKQTHPRTIQDLRNMLQSFATELAGQYSSYRLREMRMTLAQAYEELALQIRHSSASDQWMRTNTRAIRIPRTARSIFHAFNGLCFVLLYQFVLNRSQVLTLMLAFAGFFTFIEVVRRLYQPCNDFLVDKLFGQIARPQERYKITSATFYYAGLTVIAFLAPRIPVCLAILVLAIGDPAASIFGSRWRGKRFYNDKSWVGSLAFFLSSLTMTLLYLTIFSSGGFGTKLLAATTVSLVGAVVELFSDRVDDNFSVPVACALAGMIFF